MENPIKNGWFGGNTHLKWGCGWINLGYDPVNLSNAFEVELRWNPLCEEEMNQLWHHAFFDLFLMGSVIRALTSRAKLGISEFDVSHLYFPKFRSSLVHWYAKMAGHFVVFFFFKFPKKFCTSKSWILHACDYMNQWCDVLMRCFAGICLCVCLLAAVSTFQA